MSLNTVPTDPAANSYVTAAEMTTYTTDRSDVTDWAALTSQQQEAVLKLATRHIESLRFFGERLVCDPQYYRAKQALFFPRDLEIHQTGTPQTGTTTTLTDSNLANQRNRYTNFWIGGALIIIEGTNKGETRKISAFNGATGMVTVDAPFSSSINDTSQYLIVEQIPIEVKNAVCEQALYLTKGGGERARLQSEGVQSYKIGDLSETFVKGVGGNASIAVSAEAKGYLKGFISRIGQIV